MHWFLIALIGPVLYACASHTDKYLITRYLKNGEVGSLIIFGSVFSVIAMPVAMYMHPAIFDVGFAQATVLAINGTLTVLALLLYFYALHQSEASLVVPYYQTIPLFAFVLGYLLLGETITGMQSVASALIIVGALVLSFSFDGGKMVFKKKVVALMLGASLLYAINGVLFKVVAVDTGFWLSTFWGLVGKLFIGIGFFAFVPSYRFQFLAMLRVNKSAVLGLNALSESLFIVGEAVTQFATLLAPVALVLLVNSFQPFFVLVIGIFLTLVFPHIGRESLTRNSLVQKIVGMGFIGAGAYFLSI